MDTKPSGYITFLFTDIEGSTKLSQEFPDTLQSALEIHHSILQNAVESNNGFVFEIVGDAFCCAFQKAGDAVKAAVVAQLKLSEEKWENAEIRIRIGLHSGNAEWIDGKYIGYITLARAARVMSAAYGEQIIISNNTYELTNNFSDSFTKDGISFRDLGERRLKDLIQPIRLFQILCNGLREDFPPLKTLDARPNNIPVQLTSFIGREEVIKQVKTLFGQTRLLTLIGAGGVGKTRLALQTSADILDDYSNGIFLVELAPISDPNQLLQATANSLNVKEESGKSLEQTLVEYLKEKEMLIILDNCEHMITECARTAELFLKNCSKLKIIATSREVLNCPGEQVYRIPSLLFPDIKVKITPEQLSHFEAVRLFIERALAVNPAFRVNNENAPALAQICYQLDGIPLAIELAAARIKVLTLEGIYERLNDMFKLLTGGKRTALPRQQTLKALIDWSYDLLSEKEKLLWQRLTVFSDGWTLENCEAVCSDEIIDESEILDHLNQLTDKSIIKVTDTENFFRFTMLESIKKYGDEKLTASGKKNEFSEKHFNCFFRLAENTEEKLTGSAQREWLKKINAEYGNLTESLKRASKNNPDKTLMMTVMLGKYWELRSLFTSALAYLQTSLENSKSAEPVWKAKAKYWIGFFLINQGKYSESKEYLNQCLGMFRELKDKGGEALTIMTLGSLALFKLDYENLDLLTQQSLTLSKELNNKSYIARNLQNIGLGLMQRGKHDAARDKLNESLSAYRELNDFVQIAKIIGNIGVMEFFLRDYEKARTAYEESLKLRLELGDKQGLSIIYANLGSVAIMLKDYDEAEKLIEESLKIINEIGDKRLSVTTITNLGYISYFKKEYPKAVIKFREAVKIADELGDKYSLAKGIEGIANTYIDLKDFKTGCRLSSKYISILKASNTHLIDEELTRIIEITNLLKSNLEESDFKTYWEEGENLNIESIQNAAAEIINSDS